MVSPKALDTAKMTAAKMPGAVFRSKIYLLVCHLVAPSESEASFNSLGTAPNISQNRLTKRGKIMTPRTMPPANVVYPVEYST